MLNEIFYSPATQAAGNKPNNACNRHLFKMSNSQLFAIAAGLLFALVAHRLTISRDRHREFNEIAIPLGAKIRSEAEAPSPYKTAITRDDANAIGARLWWFQRARFLKHCEEYWNAKEQQHQDEIGQPMLDNPEEVKSHLLRLLPYLKPR